MFQVKLSLMPSLRPQSITNHSQWLLESLPAFRVKHRAEVSYIVADTFREHVGSDLRKSPRSSCCQILPAPGRWVSSQECSSTGGVKPPLTAPLGSCHLSGHFEAAQCCHTTQKCSHCLFPVWGALPLLRSLLLSISPKLCSLFPSSLGVFVGNTMWVSLPRGWDKAF